MRIFTAVRHSTDPKFYYGGLWSGNFHPALAELGHEVVESNVDLLPASRFMDVGTEFTPQELEVRSRLTQQVIDEVKRAHSERSIDLFLSYFYNSHFDPSGFAEIHKLGIPTINFYCNSIYQFDLVKDIAAKVNFAWHAEKDARRLYVEVGADPVWVQMAADPAVYRPVSGIVRDAKACFVGQRYADRDRWMAALIRAQVPVVIYGPGWKNGASETTGKTKEAPSSEYLGRPVPPPATLSSYLRVIAENVQTGGFPGGIARTWTQKKYRSGTQALSPLFADFAKGAIPFEQICQVFASHAVILNFSNVWGDGRPGSTLIPHVRLRDFEAPMCRTCYVTGYTDEITEFYEPEKEIITYRTPEELIDKTKYYLSNPGAAEGVREAGYARALRDHTWVQRFKQLFASVGLAK